MLFLLSFLHGRYSSISVKLHQYAHGIILGFKCILYINLSGLYHDDICNQTWCYVPSVQVLKEFSTCKHFIFDQSIIVVITMCKKRSESCLMSQLSIKT